MSLSQDRTERLDSIERLLPSDQTANSHGLTIKEISSKLDQLGLDNNRHTRTLQRDLQLLIKQGRVRTLDKTSKQPSYLRIEDAEEIDDSMWDYFIVHLKRELAGIVTSTELARLLDRLKLDEHGIRLDESKLCILPDSLRLQPAEINPQVFSTVLRALKEKLALQVHYRDRQEKSSTPTLHPQGIMQRGPRIYLFALKNDEPEERLYAIDRIRTATLLSDPARNNPDFDFQQHIAAGRADFSNGETITLKAIVRGYVEDLVRDCKLHESQKLELWGTGETGSLLTVTMPSSGQLLRWILACGSNITVIEPPELRETTINQLKHAIEKYQ
ncbi:helix-turn-helix transcriptional regulator [Laribacter hongkongensis]|uniref:helix-turn-helix transcriptional regulator n=1 Tax=Laribacter hongkongensis TaxID=168471 RepID=UPI001EFD74BD|nr:WYL domain-containing protein [Laribacter hongkongensis]MCG9084154.1 WYL domain-containing protein [Laribacter hongkongensis]